MVHGGWLHFGRRSPPRLGFCVLSPTLPFQFPSGSLDPCTAPELSKCAPQDKRAVPANPLKFPSPAFPCDHRILTGFPFLWPSLPANSSPLLSPQKEQWLEIVSFSQGLPALELNLI